MIHRRRFVGLGIGVGAAALLPAAWSVRAQEGEATGADAAPEAVDAAAQPYVLGSDDAPVTMIEFASFTCPHCATVHAQVLPILRERYIDTGQVRLVFREFPLDGLALRAGMMARCAPRAQYFNLVSALFETQQTWARASDPVAALRQLGGMAGLSGADFDACLADQALADAIVTDLQDADATYQIQSTPTFIIGGERIEGAQPVETFIEVIDRQLAASGS